MLQILLFWVKYRHLSIDYIMPKVEVSKVATLEGHNDCIYTVSPSGSAAEVISAAGDGMVVSWDLNKPKDGNLIVKTPNSVYALHPITKNNSLIVGQNFEGIHEIDLATKKELRSLKLDTKEIFDIKEFGSSLCIATKTGDVFIVNYTDFTILKKIKYSTQSARCISVGEKDFAIGYSDNKIRIYNQLTLELIKTIDAHDISVFTLSYTPDNRFLVSGSRDAHIKFWNVEQNYSIEDDLAAHMYAINHITFTEDGKYLFSCSMDKSIKVWDTKSRKLLKVIDKVRHAGHGTSINKLYWSKEKQQLIAASDDRTLTVWDITIN